MLLLLRLPTTKQQLAALERLLLRPSLAIFHLQPALFFFDEHPQVVRGVQ